MSEPACFVCLSDSLSGGAAIACNRLGMGLAKLRVNHERWHFSPPKPQPFSCVDLDARAKRPPLERLLKNVSKKAANVLRQRRHEHRLAQQLSVRRPFCLNVHNIHDSGLTHDSLDLIPPDVPMSWTLHDRWPFAVEAFKWRDAQDDAWTRVCVDGSDEALSMERRRRFFAARSALCLIAPSKWLFEEARRALPGHRIEHIPYGLPVDTFSPMDPQQARKALGLDPNKIWLGFASTWGNDRKGADLLPDALKRIASPEIGLLVWGKMPAYDWPSGITIHEAGTVEDSQHLKMLYSACDVFLCPSRADNLPNTVLEGLACGVPCAGTNVGGIPDMARPGSTGWIMPEVSAAGVAAGIQTAMQQRDQWPQIRQNCRQVAEREYSLEVQATAYRKLHEELAT